MTPRIKQVGLFLLDKSGSMESLRDQAVSGFNEYLHKLQGNKVSVDFNLVLFDDVSIDKPYIMTPLRKVEKLTRDTYVPRGLTPLYDSAVDAIKELEAKVSMIKGSVAVSVVIMTDGLENASKRYTHQDLRSLVQRLEKEKGWTFAYMGANQDAYAEAQKMGININNTLQWAADTRGTLKAFGSLASASVHHVNAMAMSLEATPTASHDYFSGAK